MICRHGHWKKGSESLCLDGGMAEMPEVMDIRVAARYLGVSRDTLYKYVCNDKVPAFKLGNRWRFKKTVLDRWMEAQSNPTGDPSRKACRGAV